jgi:hypothetical protein
MLLFRFLPLGRCMCAFAHQSGSVGQHVLWAGLCQHDKLYEQSSKHAAMHGCVV